NRAAAVAMRDGPAAGLALIDAILARGDLRDYHLAHSARADLCRRLGRTAEARAAYERALSLTRQEPERRFLAGRLAGARGRGRVRRRASFDKLRMRGIFLPRRFSLALSIPAHPRRLTDENGAEALRHEVPVPGLL